MGKYTILANPAADAAVQEVLDRVCGELKALLKDRLRAVVLVGGYGRGEGGIYLENGAYRLVNDLDLLVFVNRGWKAEPGLQHTFTGLARRILPEGRGLKAIDLELASVWRQRILARNTVGYYETAAGNQVIYGDSKVSARFRTLDPARLPVYEGANYFRNRGSGLLIPALYFLTDSLGDPGKRKNFQIEMHKACQAMGDALLLLGRQYHYSYRERLRRFQRLEPGALGLPGELHEQIGPLYEWGMTQKLSPNFAWPGDQEMVERWFLVQETFGRFFLWFESARLGRKFGDWVEYATHVEGQGAGEPWTVKARALWGGMRRALKRAPNGFAVPGSPLHGLMVMPLLLFALFPDLRVASEYLYPAAKILRQSPAAADVEQWRQLTGLYLTGFYPKDIVRQALSPSGSGKNEI